MEYVYACAAGSADDMVGMVHHTLGRKVLAQVWADGSLKTREIIPVAFGGDWVAFRYGSGRFTLPVVDVFGQGVTRVLPESA